jgi:MFS family permease
MERSMGKTTKSFNRWLVVFGAVLIQLALGAIYAWSVFTARLTDPNGAYAFTASETAWIFSAGLATFAIVMVFAGRWLPRVGPRALAGIQRLRHRRHWWSTPGRLLQGYGTGNRATDRLDDTLYHRQRRLPDGCGDHGTHHPAATHAATFIAHWWTRTRCGNDFS